MIKVRTIALLVLVFAPACATAQANTDSVHLRNDCRLARQVLTTGNPRPRMQWAAEQITRCPDVGATLAEALSLHRTSTDTTELYWLTNPANSLQDGRTFEAATSIFEDRGASSQARVYAARVLYWLLYPSAGVYYGTLTDVNDDGHWPCVLFGASSHMEVVRGTPLPPNWRSQLRQTAGAIMRDQSQPAPVRQSAVCLVLRAGGEG